MKRLLTILLLCACISAPAQNHITDSYNRSSITLVSIGYGDKYDSYSNKIFKNLYDNLEKFDQNKIKTNMIKVSSPRNTNITLPQVTNFVSSSTLGREVIKFWYDSDNDGFMTDSLIWKRGRYNATDSEVKVSATSKIGEYKLFDSGYKLIDNSYIILLDYCNIAEAVSVETVEKFDLLKGKTKENIEYHKWSLVTKAYLFKVNFGAEDQDLFYENYWVDSSLSKDEADKRRSAFSTMDVKVSLVESVDIKIESKKIDAADRAYNPNSIVEDLMIRGSLSAFTSFETAVDSWKVASSVSSVKPIKAQIGTKEGLKNGQRYRAYETHSNGANLYSKSVGYLRATNVAKNSSDATGDSSQSEFYQISGGKNIKPGMTLKNSGGIRTDVSAMYNIGGLSDFNLSFDVLLSIKTKGNSSYFITDVGYALPDSNIGDAISELKSVSFLNVGLGYGYGVHLTRFVEIKPYVLAVGDFICDLPSSIDTSGSTLDKIGWYAKGGIKAKVSIAYPISLVVGANYSYLIHEEDTYKAYNELIDNSQNSSLDKRKGGFAFSAGICCAF